VERWQREQILGEWGVRDGSARGLREGRALAEDPAAPDFAGRPLRRRLRNFRTEPDRYLASLGGPLPYMRRLREIAEEVSTHERELAAARHALAAECGGDPALFERRWRARAEGWDFWWVNRLIDRHNRYYPIESNLPMDPRTGDFALVGGRPYRREPLGAEWILERFPASLEHVAAADDAA
jgi:hypothetical protein